MKDIEYLKEAVAKRYLCPKCRQDYLKFEEETGAVCLACGEDSLLGFHFSLSPPDT